MTSAQGYHAKLYLHMMAGQASELMFICLLQLGEVALAKEVVSVCSAGNALLPGWCWFETEAMGEGVEVLGPIKTRGNSLASNAGELLGIQCRGNPWHLILSCRAYTVGPVCSSLLLSSVVQMSARTCNLGMLRYKTLDGRCTFAVLCFVKKSVKWHIYLKTLVQNLLTSTVCLNLLSLKVSELGLSTLFPARKH